MGSVPDFTETEQWKAQNAVDERWGKGVVELHPADVETIVSPEDKSLTSCPALFWTIEDCNFVLLKVSEDRYRCQFFYKSDLENQLGTGTDEFDEISECAVTLLRAQADYDSVRSGAFPDS